MKLPVILFIALLLPVACHSGSEPGADRPSDTMPEQPKLKIPEHLRDWHRQARADLANRLEIAPEEISTVEAADVTWPDGSLGCPEAGMMYTQALVPGYRLVFRVDGRNHYYYHGQTGRPPFYCSAKRARKPRIGTEK